MSLSMSPVCASCGKCSDFSISCTKCLKVCCTACFNVLVDAMTRANVDVSLLTARVCRKCVESEVNPSAVDSVVGNDTANANGSDVHRERCNLHGKERTLFCVNCSVIICASCIGVGEIHGYHRIDNLVPVYLEKALRVRDKIVTAEKLNNLLYAENKDYRRNIEFIEREEADMLKEIETMAEASRLEVSSITTVRKDILKARLEIPSKNRTILENIRETAKQISPYRLMDLLPEFEANCDELISQDNNIMVQCVNDIECGLISQYATSEIVFGKFYNAAYGDVCVCHMKAKFDIEWKFTVKKADIIQIESSTDNESVEGCEHKLMVMIIHRDYGKRIFQSFDLEGQCNTIDVVHSSLLIEEGFCSEEDGDLVIKIGIRCKNILFEMEALELQYDDVTESIDYKYLVMYFHPKLIDLQRNKRLRSSYITDDENRKWYLLLDLNEESNMVEAYVYLHRGPDARCIFFVELKHQDSKKNILRVSKPYDFNETDHTNCGWQPFLMDNLNSDDGFHPDGHLHFRFGVRSFPSSTDSHKPSAANA